MNDKDLLNILGLNDRTINIGLDDEFLQITLEKKIDNYLKKLDEEKKRKEEIDFLKQKHKEYEEKQKYLNMFNDSFVYGKVRNKLIQDGFVYQCRYCWGLDVSGQYGKQTKPKK